MKQRLFNVDSTLNRPCFTMRACWDISGASFEIVFLNLLICQCVMMAVLSRSVEVLNKLSSQSWVSVAQSDERPTGAMAMIRRS